MFYLLMGLSVFIVILSIMASETADSILLMIGATVVFCTGCIYSILEDIEKAIENERDL